MMKLSKKGFVLVETLIVTVFVVSLFIVVYKFAIPVIGEYEKNENFDDVDSVYLVNSWKQNLMEFGNFEYIDSQLSTKSYLDISDCSNENVYTEVKYCKNLKSFLNIDSTDYIFITNNNISRFREEVNRNEFFDAGKLSGFRSYISTLANIESGNSNKYRIFIARDSEKNDGSIIIKYANLSLSPKKKELGVDVPYEETDGFDVIPNKDETPIDTRKTLYDTIMASNSIKLFTPDLKNTSGTASSQSGLYKSTATNSGQPTYYFRGNTNNYVKFVGANFSSSSNQYWRIIRINEDGSIRMIYPYDIGYNNSLIVNDVYEIGASIDYKAFAKAILYYNYDSQFSSQTSGYSYGGGLPKKKLNDWYDTLSDGIKKYVVKGTFCEAMKVTDISDNTAGEYAMYNLGVTMSSFTDYSPTFVCNTDVNGHGITKQYIGLLSLDENIYAGDFSYFTSGATVSPCYGDTKILTMSPAGFIKSGTHIGGDYSNAINFYAYVWTNKWEDFDKSKFHTYFRYGDTYLWYLDKDLITKNKGILAPVINLSSDIKVKSGSGSSYDPYVLTFND